RVERVRRLPREVQLLVAEAEEDRRFVTLEMVAELEVDFLEECRTLLQAILALLRAPVEEKSLLVDSGRVVEPHARNLADGLEGLLCVPTLLRLFLELLEFRREVVEVLLGLREALLGLLPGRRARLLIFR